jgi:hypothetical protein
MKDLILNNIQSALGTESKPVWTEYDEQALDYMLKDFDFRSAYPDMTYNQFKDYVYETMHELAARDIIESTFGYESFEKGGTLFYQKGVTGNGVPSGVDYVDLTGTEYFDLVNKITGKDTSRRAVRGREEISNLANTQGKVIRVYKNGQIEYLGKGWNTSVGSGKNFTKDKPNILKQLGNFGENKAQLIHNIVSDAVANDSSLLDQYFPKKEEPAKQESVKQDPIEEQPVSKPDVTKPDVTKEEPVKKEEKPSRRQPKYKPETYVTIEKEFNSLSPIKRLYYQKAYLMDKMQTAKGDAYIKFHKKMMEELNKFTDQQIKEALLEIIGYKKQNVPKIGEVYDLDVDVGNNIGTVTYRYFPGNNRLIPFKKGTSQLLEGDGFYTDDLLERTLFQNENRRNTNVAKNKVPSNKNGGLVLYQTGAEIAKLKTKTQTDTTTRNTQIDSSGVKSDTAKVVTDKPGNRDNNKVDKSFWDDPDKLYFASAVADALSIISPEPISAGVAAIGSQGLDERARYLLRQKKGESYGINDFLYSAANAGANIASIVPIVGDVALLPRVFKKLKDIVTNRNVIIGAITATGLYNASDATYISDTLNNAVKKYQNDPSEFFRDPEVANILLNLGQVIMGISNKAKNFVKLDPIDKSKKGLTYTQRAEEQFGLTRSPSQNVKPKPQPQPKAKLEDKGPGFWSKLSDNISNIAKNTVIGAGRLYDATTTAFNQGRNINKIQKNNP